MKTAKQPRLLKPHIYKALLAISIIAMYTGFAALSAGHAHLGISAIIITMIIMIIATNEEYNKQQVKQAK